MIGRALAGAASLTPATRLRAYLVAVGLSGGAALVALASAHAWPPAGITTTHWLLFGFLILAELLPIRVRGHEDEVTTSAAFSFALLATVGLAPAALAQAVACLIADLRGSRSLPSALFNVGQYTLSLAAGAMTVAALTDLPRSLHAAPLTGQEVLGLAAGGVLFFAVNNVLAGTAYALASRRPIVEHLREDLAFQTVTAALVLGLVPLVLTVSHHQTLLLPLIALPLFAVYRASRDARIAHHQARHDRLTGLPNRTQLADSARAALAVAQDRRVGLLMMDLDRFKDINDTLGHRHGDELLCEVAARLRAVARDGEIVARFGGDEFAVLLPRVESIEEAEDAARRFLAPLSDPIAVQELHLRVEGSIGVACFPDHGADVDELIRRGDVAMYVAKSRKLGIQRYEPADDQHSVERLALAGDLRHAIASNQLVLFYQPVVDVMTGELVGAEALVRWQHPERGLVPPDEFIPTAEATGAIRELTSETLHMAVRQAVAWRGSGLEIPVSVNVSVQDVLDEALPDEIAALLIRYGLPAQALKIELTESMLMADPQRAHDVLSALDDMGVRIAIDDFGTGYSSLAYLARLPVDQLKIDRGFIRDLDERNNAVIVASIIELARQLGLRTVAEGVETARAASAMAAQRCDFAQGYLFSRPLPATEFETWARTHLRTERRRAPGGLRAQR
jgi:diguanylate cyclase (GGDEF)-like protein